MNDEGILQDGDLVLTRYEGVYGWRLVTYWIDAGGISHFGMPDEIDGKGSQPATHYISMSNVEAAATICEVNY